MRIFILFSLLVTFVSASDSVDFFNNSKDNKLMCHVGQYSFKMITHDNAVLEDIHNHKFFKLKDENLYFLSNSCQPINKKQGIFF